MFLHVEFWPMSADPLLGFSCIIQPYGAAIRTGPPKEMPLYLYNRGTAFAKEKAMTTKTNNAKTRTAEDAAGRPGRGEEPRRGSEMIAATPTKLRSGAWGARTREPVSQGDTVTITTRAGKSWQARVTRVVWSGSGVSVCATESLDRPARRNGGGRSRSGGVCAECEEPRRNLTECRDSSGIVARCCPRCAALSPWERSFA